MFLRQEIKMHQVYENEYRSAKKIAISCAIKYRKANYGIEPFFELYLRNIINTGKCVSQQN